MFKSIWSCLCRFWQNSRQRICERKTAGCKCQVYRPSASGTVSVLPMVCTGCFKKVTPLKLFGIFSLQLSLFAWNFANLLAIIIHMCLPIFVHLSYSSNGINFSMSTHHFHRVRFWVLKADALWTRLGEKAIISSYPDKGWKLSTVKKVGSWFDHIGSAVLHKPGSGRLAPVSACAVCRFKTMFPLLGSTKL